MSVLFIYINAWSATGGIQKFNRNFLSAMDLASNTSEGKQYVLSLHDTINDFPEYKSLHLHSASGNRLLFIWKAFFLSFKCKKVFVGHVNILFPLAFLCIRPISLITHGIEIWRPLAWYKKSALKRVSEIITVSNYTKKRIQSIFPFFKNEIRLLPNTIDTDFEEKSMHADATFLHTKFALNPICKIVLTVCRLSSGEGEKGYDKVIKSLSALIKLHPDIVYVLAGKYDEIEKKRLDALIETLELSRSVLFTGYVATEDLPSVYASCDVFIMPSKKEGFGIVFLEALLAGKVVIGGNMDGTVDALQEGDTGLLINPDSETEIESALGKSLIQYRGEEIKTRAAYVRMKTLEVYGFKKFTERVRTLLTN
jgi:phosphatidylinositol alpha-1,6-mannosyltransferase